MIDEGNLWAIGGTGHNPFDRRVLELFNLATGYRVPFRDLDFYPFADGEPGTCFPEEDIPRIEGKNVILFSSPITAELREEMMDLMNGARLQYKASSITVVLPFLPFRRQDHSEKNQEITRLRLFLRNLRNWGADRLVVCDPHSPENTGTFADEFGLKLFIADPTKLFADALRPYLQTLCGSGDEVKVYSPDFGSVGRALALAKALGTSVIATPKYRANASVSLVRDDGFLDRMRERYGAEAPVSCDLGQIKGAHVIIREDEIATGSTAVMTAGQLRENGAKTMHIVATHPVCSVSWKDKMFPLGKKAPFDSVWFGNTRPRGKGTRYQESTGGKVQEVSMAPVVASALVEAVRSIGV